MKNKILKIVTVIMLLVVLTATNLIYVGMGVISYAADSISTNNSNIEFDADLKDENTLSIVIDVKKEGYFNGEIALENSNFTFVPNQVNEYINNIENNKLIVNQINAGTKAQFDLQIEAVNAELFDTSLLNMTSKINLTGIYRDSKEKDISIKAAREVKLEYTEDNSEENIENIAKVITNKIIKVSGEDKRVVQLEMSLGLKENNYPVKEINSIVNLPKIESKNPTVIEKVNLNTMQIFTYSYDEKNTVSTTLINEPNTDNKVLWKKQGNEKVVLTLIYDKDVDLDNTEISYEEKVILYNQKELKTANKILLDNEEKEEVVNVTISNMESNIYKGKLYAGIDRNYESRTDVAVNLANAGQGIDIKEEQAKYMLDGREAIANTVFNKTMISKESFDKILGENGQITILNEKGEILEIVTNKTEVDENNNIVIEYTGKEPSSLEIKITTPIAEGDLSFVQTKTIKAQDKTIVKSATEIATNIIYKYNENEQKETKAITKLEETKTEVALSVDRDTLSTVVSNNVEIKAVLKVNNEKYNLYKNPSIIIELPEDVENIEVNSINLIYENELRIRNYELSGRILTVYLEGEQTQYKNSSIEGTVIIANINVNVNKKAATKDAEIKMTINNENQQIIDSRAIKIVAPKDVTAINSIKELMVETLGQEATEEVTLEKGQMAKQLEASIELINNNENAIENVRIIGTFPTRNNQNNIDTKIIEGVSLESVEGEKIYYTENENATEDIEDASNGWTEDIIDTTKVQKYLVEVPSIEAQSSIQGSYKLEVPALLEYNQIAEEGYTATYKNQLTQLGNSVNATTIKMKTGVGPVLEAKLVPVIGGVDELENVTVRNGEIIKYKIEVSNTGSEDIENAIVAGEVPEGTTLVVPEENYEYTGASYYKELEDKVFATQIDKIVVGQTITKEYEVRVNSGIKAGTKLTNTAQVRYGDVLKQSNSTELTTAEGKIRVSVKRVTDRKVDLYESGTVQYFAIIENISGTKQDNVQIKTNLPSGLEVEKLELFTGMPVENASDEVLYNVDNVNDEMVKGEIKESEIVSEDSVKSEEIEFKNPLNIGSLKEGETKVLSYDLLINKLNSDTSDFSIKVINGDEEYKSNVVTDEVKTIDISLDLTSNTASQYIKSGETLEYTIVAKNNGTESIEGLVIKDNIPSSLTIDRITVNGQQLDKVEDINDIEISCNIDAKAETVIKIETLVNYSAARTEAEAITNSASAEMLGMTIKNTPELTHIIEADTQGNLSGESSGDIANGNGIITGIAWFDENANGQKDNEEKTLNNIKVYLLNTETNNLVKDANGNTLEAITNDSGIYILNNIGNGNYIAIFEYNKTLYTLTKYKAENVEESKNSNAIAANLLIENEQQLAASTDIIKIDNNNVSNINIGLIELKDFAFRLDKYVSRILIQNSAGTTVKEYTNATVAKAELDRKKVDGTTVIIEYEIRVTNIGEVDGYVRKIVDYVPNDLKFSSELNQDWYQIGSDLYTASLANEKIAAGDSKSVKLTLTKAMTENNTGLINNTAEIAESYSELGLADTQSTSGNKVQGENDYGSADAILSIKTGAETYISIIFVILLLGGVTLFVIIRKKQDNGDRE